MRELAEIADSDVRRRGLGGLAMLAAGGPAALANDVSTIAPLADRWRRAHASMPPQSMLTRDLRSTTAQLRTVGGQVWHLTTHLLSSPSARLQPDQRIDLQILRRELQRFDAAARDVEGPGESRLSDLSGQGSSGDGDGLPGPEECDGPEPAQVIAASVPLVIWWATIGLRLQLIDAVDELLWSAEQVADGKQHTVSVLIAAGRLFVPRREAAQSRAVLPSAARRRDASLQAEVGAHRPRGLFRELTGAAG